MFKHDLRSFPLLIFVKMPYFHVISMGFYRKRSRKLKADKKFRTISKMYPQFLFGVREYWCIIMMDSALQVVCLSVGKFTMEISNHDDFYNREKEMSILAEIWLYFVDLFNHIRWPEVIFHFVLTKMACFWCFCKRRHVKIYLCFQLISWFI